MTRYRATVAYDGAAYQGFQRQAGDTPTIQGALEAAIAAVTRQTVTVSGAGRTDTGVHATGQVIAFDVNWKRGDDTLLKALNAVLPPDIALQALTPASESFHPRFSALARVYEYVILQTAQRQPLARASSWQIHKSLDGDLLHAGAGLLIGRHDFGAFGQPTQGDSTVREIYRSEWRAQGERWIYTVEANGFLQHMVRRIVGMLVDVARGWKSLEQFEAAFRHAALVQAWTIAPPQGLTLVEVKYPLEIAPDFRDNTHPLSAEPGTLASFPE